MIRRLLLALVFAMTIPALPAPSAFAQASKDPITAAAPPPPPVEGEGDPLWGYLGTAAIAVVIIMAVCKSSRRS